MEYSQWNSVPEFIVSQLTEMITSGEYKPGDRFLTEKEVCSQLNVGRSSAREAFRILQALGLVDVQKGRGTFVAQAGPVTDMGLHNWYQKNRPNVQDVIEVRILLETLAIEKAIDNIMPEQLERLKSNVESCRQVIQKKSEPSFVFLDEEFHNIICEASGNELLADMSRQIQKLASEYRGKTFLVSKYNSSIAATHQKILDYIIAKDKTSAVGEIRHHILTVLEYFSEAPKVAN